MPCFPPNSYRRSSTAMYVSVIFINNFSRPCTYIGIVLLKYIFLLRLYGPNITIKQKSIRDFLYTISRTNTLSHYQRENFSVLLSIVIEVLIFMA